MVNGLIPMALSLAVASPFLSFSASHATLDPGGAAEAIVLRGFAIIGAQDVTLVFAPETGADAVVAPGPPVVGPVCELIVLASAAPNAVWGWQPRRAEDTQERRLALRVALASGEAMSPIGSAATTASEAWWLC